ncbi:MAG: Proline dehydrogenase / Delta-1-pyrroline-5-carboxylate dehydrogenase, partial [uncultured Solirubrobacteraceae bacterium]
APAFCVRRGDPRDRPRALGRHPVARPPPAGGPRRQGHGSRLPGRPAQGRALSLRGRRARLPLGRRPRRAPLRLPVRGGREARRARAGPAPGRLARGPRRARHRRRGRREAHGPPVHRRGESPGRRRRAGRPVEARRHELGRPARRGDGHQRGGRRLRPALLGGTHHAQPCGGELARAAGDRAGQRGGAAAREPLREGLRAHPAAARRRPGAREPRCGAATARAPAPGCGCGRAPSRRHGELRLARGDDRPRPRAPRRARVRRRPVGRRRPAGVPPRLARAGRPPGAVGARHAAFDAAHGPLGQGRLLGPRGRRRAPARLDAAGLRGEGRLRRELRAPHACPARRPDHGRGRPGRRREPQPAFGRPRRGLQPRVGSPGRGSRAPGASGPGRRAPDRAGEQRPARSDVLPRRRPRRGHGLPRPATAREHLQRLVPARAGRGRPARTAARRAGRRDM